MDQLKNFYSISTNQIITLPSNMKWQISHEEKALRQDTPRTPKSPPRLRDQRLAFLRGPFLRISHCRFSLCSHDPPKKGCYKSAFENMNQPFNRQICRTFFRPLVFLALSASRFLRIPSDKLWLIQIKTAKSAKRRRCCIFAREAAFKAKAAFSFHNISSERVL